VTGRVLSALLLLALCPAARAGDPARATLFLAEGAGDTTGCSESLAATLARGEWPADLVRFGWSHGPCQTYLDQVDTPHARRQAAALADLIAEHVRAGKGPVVLVGYSAGTAVVVFAAELLPPGTVDRIVLLAPSMSASYDLGPAAIATKKGVDVFASRRDCWALGIGVRLAGGADELRSRLAAGRLGYFSARGECECGPGVRQYFWRHELRHLGHDGGHYGCFAPAHLQEAVLPVIFGP
jgi:pimeloyl-ACP methyl ester carboxylesterase